MNLLIILSHNYFRARATVGPSTVNAVYDRGLGILPAQSPTLDADSNALTCDECVILSAVSTFAGPACSNA